SDRPLRSQRDGCTVGEWWDQVLDDTRESGLVIAINEVKIPSAGSVSAVAAAVQDALQRFVQRRGARLVLLSDDRDANFLPNLQNKWTSVIRLQPLGWDDVYSWIQRNRPALTRYTRTDLAMCFSRLGENFELWSALSDFIEDADPGTPLP